MGTIEYSVDWIQYSVAWPDAVTEWPINERNERAIVQTCIPAILNDFQPYSRPDDDKIFNMQGYSKTYDMLYATAHVNPNRRDMRIGVRLTGDELRAYRAMGGTDARLMEFIRNVKGKPSRIDLALDLRGYNINPMRVYEDWKRDIVVCRARTVRPFTSAVREPDGTVSEASTLYFGSRTSETMIRLYEKGKQVKDGSDWLRLEAELKGERAEAIAYDCERLGVRMVVRQVMLDFFTTMPYKFWRDIVKGEYAELTPVRRKQSAREVWIFEVIFPMLREEIAAEWESLEERGIIRELESMLRSHWTERARAYVEQYGLPKRVDIE